MDLGKGPRPTTQTARVNYSSSKVRFYLIAGDLSSESEKNSNIGSIRLKWNTFEYDENGEEMMRIIVGVSGASGSILAENLLRAFRLSAEVETHLVVSKGALRTLQLESSLPEEEFLKLADKVHPNADLAASIASGSFITNGMVVIPCSMKTLAKIAHGYSDNLLLRAADVCLKERRKLILVTREMPLSTLHLENMLKASQYGAMIMPPMLTFYHHPRTIDDLINHLTGKILTQFGLDDAAFQAWQGN
jgi:polyprenyl P-hydroxybenzoate/phenylacrylic acid decarboxylase-like protein